MKKERKMANKISEIKTTLEKITHRLNIIENNNTDYWESANYKKLRAKREELYKLLEKEQENIDK